MPTPAQQSVARINARRPRLGLAPLDRPAARTFRSLGDLPAQIDAMLGNSRSGGGDDSIRGGDLKYDSDSGKGRLERELRSVLADIDEGRSKGDITQEQADKYEQNVAKITEGLYAGNDLPDWMNDKDTLAAFVEHAHQGKTASERVSDAGTNVLTSALRQASRPGQASLSAIRELNKEGEEHPVKVGPLSINSALLSAVVPVPLLKDDVRKRVAGEARKGWNLHTDASPGNILNDTADIREKQGKGRGYLGSHFRDVSNDPIINNPAVDLAVYAATDPLSYVGFGIGTAGKGALRAAEKAVPGVSKVLREGGLEALTVADREALERVLPARAMELLKTAQGGVRIKAPFGHASEGSSVIPGKTIRAPFRAVAESEAGRAVAETGAAKAVKSAARTAQETFVPRAAVRRLGGNVESVFDDMRVALTEGASAKTQRNIDKAINAARKIPDLTFDEIGEVGRALDIGGNIAAIPPRLKPLGDLFDQWRAALTQEQVDHGVLMGADARMGSLEGVVNTKRNHLGGLQERLAALTDDEAAKIAGHAPTAPEPMLGKVDEKLTKAGYRGGVSDTKAARLADESAGAADEVAQAADDAAGVRGRDLTAGDDVTLGADGLPDVPRTLTPEQLAAREAREVGPIERAGRMAERKGRRIRRSQAAEAARAESAAGSAMKASDDLLKRSQRVSDRSFKAGQRSIDSVQAIRKAKAGVQREIKVAETELAAAEDAFARGVVADEDYFPRILTPDAVKVMNAVEDGRISGGGATGVRQALLTDKFVTARRPEWAQMSIPEINAEMAPLMDEARDLGIIKPDPMTLKGAAEIVGVRKAGPSAEWFDTNPFTAFATRDQAARRHIVGKQFYETLLDVADDAGNPVARRVDDLDPELADQLAFANDLKTGKDGARERIARTYTGNDEWTFMDVPPLGAGMESQTYLVRKEIAGDLEQVVKAFQDPGKLGKFFDQWQGLWKAYATVPLPFGLGFHLRNAEGNVFLNWLAGLTDMTHYVRASKLQRAASKGVKDFGDPLHYLDESDRVLVRDAMDHGVIGNGFVDIDVARAPEAAVVDSRGRRAVGGKRLRGGWNAANPLSTDFVLIEQGRKLGSSVENNARMAHFLWKMADLGDPAEAARSVRRSLFDYGDITPFERGVMKRLIPFYTFMRKSAPTVIEGFATAPSKLSRIQQARMIMAEDAEDPEGLYPGFLEEGAAVPLPKGVSRGLSKIPGLGFDPDTQLAFSPDLPLLGPAENLTDALSVASALPLVPNVTQREPVEGLQGLIGLIGGGAPGALSTAAQVALGRRFFGGSSLDDRNIEASLPARMLQLDRNREVDGKPTASMTAKADFILESLFPLASKVPFGNKSEQDKQPRRLASMLTGLRLYPLGESTQEQEAYRRRDELKQFIEALYAQGILTEGDDGRAAKDQAETQAEADLRKQEGIDDSEALTDQQQQEIEDLMDELDARGGY